MDQLLLRNLRQAIQNRRDYIVDSLTSKPETFLAEYRFQQGVLYGLNQALDIVKELNQKNLSDDPE